MMIRKRQPAHTTVLLTIGLCALLGPARARAQGTEAPGAPAAPADAERAAIADEVLRLHREASQIFDSDLDCEEIVNRFAAVRRFERLASQGRLIELGSRDETVEMCRVIKQDRLSAHEDLQEEHVEVLGRDTALVVWRSIYTVRFKDGRSMVRPQVVSTIWARSAEGWRMVHFHESWQEADRTTSTEGEPPEQVPPG